MNLRFRFRVAAILSAALLSPAGHAQLFRAYLAVDGLDTNPCTLQLPCRLLPAALAAVASGGEIWMLDSANYNASSVTVAKSVTILAVPGVVGSLVAHGGPALLISGDSHKITVRNLVLVPLTGGTGTHGIHMTGLTLLRIENGVFANFGGHVPRHPRDRRRRPGRDRVIVPRHRGLRRSCRERRVCERKPIDLHRSQPGREGPGARRAFPTRAWS
jgi:hypothetical protein